MCPNRHIFFFYIIYLFFRKIFTNFAANIMFN